jgi:hypothetical protein
MTINAANALVPSNFKEVLEKIESHLVVEKLCKEFGLLQG